MSAMAPPRCWTLSTISVKARARSPLHKSRYAAASQRLPAGVHCTAAASQQLPAAVHCTAVLLSCFLLVYIVLQRLLSSSLLVCIVQQCFSAASCWCTLYCSASQWLPAGVHCTAAVVCLSAMMIRVRLMFIAQPAASLAVFKVECVYQWLEELPCIAHCMTIWVQHPN